MDKIRLRFKKTGRSVYISHLDLMHTLQRGFSRAGYSLKYSEGFNPHPQISIALPLSVGAASLCEILDFKLKEDADLTTMAENLSRVMPEGIEMIEAYEASRKTSEIKWLQVEGIMEYDSRDAKEMCAELEKFFTSEEIVIMKKTKRGVGEADIKPAIKSIAFSALDTGVKVAAMISAQEPTLNPDLLVDALRQINADICPDFAKFTRIETYTAAGEVFR